MKLRSKVIFFSVLLVFQFSGSAQIGNNQPDTAMANKTWNNLPNLNGFWSRSGKEYNNDRKKAIKEYQILARKFRIAGLEFWNKYPEDPRRFKWFYLTTTAFQPAYWQDLDLGAEENINGKLYTGAFDNDALQEWNTIYPSLEKTFMAFPGVSDKERMNIQEQSFWSDIDALIHLVELLKCSPLPTLSNRSILIQQTHELIKDSLSSFINKYYSLYKKGQFGSTGLTVASQLSRLGWGYKESFGFSSLDELARFMGAFMNTIDPEAAKVAKGIVNFAAMQHVPMILKSKTIEGKGFDIKDYRGKIVLLDIWGTSCTTCVENMAYIKEVYQKYHENGFEVISICINPESDIESVKKIEEKVGVSWPLIMAGGAVPKDTGSLYQELCVQYGFIGVPQLLLIDQKGLIAESGHALIGARLEPLVEKALSK